MDESYFNTLVDLCRGIRPGSFASLPSTSSETKDDKKTIPTELELVDIERSQIEDLVAMRMRPDLLPYRRYIYVGEMSLDRRTRDLVSGKGVEFISPDDFVAVFSGVSFGHLGIEAQRIKLTSFRLYSVSREVPLTRLV